MKFRRTSSLQTYMRMFSICSVFIQTFCVFGTIHHLFFKSVISTNLTLCNVLILYCVAIAVDTLSRVGALPEGPRWIGSALFWHLDLNCTVCLVSLEMPFPAISKPLSTLSVSFSCHSQSHYALFNSKQVNKHSNTYAPSLLSAIVSDRI